MVHRRTIEHRTVWFVVFLSCCASILLESAVLADGIPVANSPSVSDNIPGQSARRTTNLTAEPSESDLRDANGSVLPDDKADAVSDASSADGFDEALVGGGKVGKIVDNKVDDNKEVVAGRDEISLWRTMMSLIIVLTLIVICAYAFRRFALGSRSRRGSSVIEIIARQPILGSPKQSLSLVKLGHRFLLVGMSPNHIAPLLTIDDPDEIAHIMGLLEKQSPGSITNTFDKLFHRESQDYVYPPGNSHDVVEDGDDQFYDDDGRPVDSPQWSGERRELSSLLSKVKGLTRIRLRS